MRDKLKNNEYWEKVIEEDSKRIDKFEIKLKSKEVKEERINDVREWVETIRFSVLCSMFSGGKSIKECNQTYNIYLKNISQYINKKDSYITVLWIISLQILFNNNSDNEVSYCRTIIGNYGRNDYLINLMMHYLDNSWEVNGDYFMKDPYKNLDKVIHSDKDRAVLLLKDYLENKWYKAHYEEGWYNSHKSKNDTYFGYWAFETGAIAKILNLDDSCLKDVPYYPYDLVHYKSN